MASHSSHISLAVGLLVTLPTLAQEPTPVAPLSTVSLGFSGGSGIPFTPMSPTRLEIGKTSSVRTNAEAGSLSGTPAEVLSLSVLVRVARGEWLLQPEVGYQFLTSSPLAYEDDYPMGFGGIITVSREDVHNFRSNQISLGVLTGRYLDTNQRFYLLAGPAVGLRIGGHDYGESRTELGEEIRRSLNKAPATTRLFVQGGLGYWGLARHLNFELRYVHGITPLVRKLTFRDQEYALKAQGHMLLLTMAFTYDIKRNNN